MKIQILIIIVFLLVITPVLADQIVWDNDSDILVFDTWDDIDGSPLNGATCSWAVYNPDLTLNQSGTPSLSIGILNFTVSQLITIQLYPMLINCTKNGFNGTSTIREIKIVDELTEDFKDNLEEINITTKEINETTHMTYDLLINDINVTLTTIVQNTDFALLNLTEISSSLTTISNNIDILVDKWGNENANRIKNSIKDLETDFQNLEFRVNFLSSDEINARLDSIKRDSKELLDNLDKKSPLLKWFIPGIIVGIFILIIILSVILSKKRNKVEFNLKK